MAGSWVEGNSGGSVASPQKRREEFLWRLSSVFLIVAAGWLGERNFTWHWELLPQCLCSLSWVFSFFSFTCSKVRHTWSLCLISHCAECDPSSQQSGWLCFPAKECMWWGYWVGLRASCRGGLSCFKLKAWAKIMKRLQVWRGFLQLGRNGRWWEPEKVPCICAPAGLEVSKGLNLNWTRWKCLRK